MFRQPRAVFRKAEIPILFLDEDHLAPFRTKLPLGIALLVGEELLLPHAVVPAVPRLVEIALVVQLLQHGLHRADVTRVGRLGPTVISNVELGPERLELRRDLAGKLGRRHPHLLGRLLHFLAVLIHAGEKKDATPALAMPARDHIGQHLLVGVTDVGRRVRVIDRRGDEKSFRRHSPTIKAAPRPQPNVKKRPGGDYIIGRRTCRSEAWRAVVNHWAKSSICFPSSKPPSIIGRCLAAVASSTSPRAAT